MLLEEYIMTQSFSSLVLYLSDLMPRFLAEEWRIRKEICSSWLRYVYYATSRKTLGSTQLLTERSTRNLPGGGGGKGRPARKADNLTAICELIV
jgi:hypothetical protein